MRGIAWLTLRVPLCGIYDPPDLVGSFRDVADVGGAVVAEGEVGELGRVGSAHHVVGGAAVEGVVSGVFDCAVALVGFGHQVAVAVVGVLGSGPGAFGGKFFRKYLLAGNV